MEEVVERKPKRNTLVIVLVSLLSLVVILAGAFGWFYYYGPCGKTRVANAVEDFSNLQHQWNATLHLALNTSRFVLSGPVGELQDIRDQADGVKIPPCLEDGKILLLDSMDSTIDSFLAAMSQEPGTKINFQFGPATIFLLQFADELNRIAACMPFCSKP